MLSIRTLIQQMLAEQLFCAGHCASCEEYSIQAAKPLPVPSGTWIAVKASFLAAVPDGLKWGESKEEEEEMLTIKSALALSDH